MTRQEAIEAAALIIGNADLAAGGASWAKLAEGDLPASGADNWGKLADLVLDMTGRTDLADAIWEGR